MDHQRQSDAFQRESPSDPAMLVLEKEGLTLFTGPRCFTASVWLLGRSKPHRNWLIADIDRYIVPPLELNQAWVFFRGQKPVGFFSWAYLTLKAEQGLINNTRRIQPEDWNAGDRRWTMDVIAPFGDLRAIFAFKKAKGFPNGSGRYQRLDHGGRVKRVHTF